MLKAQKAFIDMLVPIAQAEYKRGKVLPSLTIAQAILESYWGRSKLAKGANNLFGIKWTKGYEPYEVQTDEYYTETQYKALKKSGAKFILVETVKGDKPYHVRITAAFRKYKTIEDSVKDHTNLLLNGMLTRFPPVKRYRKVLAATDYKTACKEVQAAGYATSPTYAAQLIRVIECYGLNKYDVKG